MSERIEKKRLLPWPALYSLAVFCLYAYFVLWPVNFYLARTLSVRLYPLATVALAALYYLRRGLRDGPELKLMSAYVLWFALTRLLCGDLAQRQDLPLVIGLLLCCLCLGPGLMLAGRGRALLLWAMGALLGDFCLVLGCLGLFAALRGVVLINPITEGNLAGMAGFGKLLRLSVLDQNPNVTAMWFYLALCLLLCLIALCRGRLRLLRIPLALAALVDYLALSLTHSRNVKLVFALSMALLLALLLRRLLRLKSRALLALLLAAAALAAVPLSYMSCGLAARALGRLAVSAQTPAAVTQTAPAPAAPQAAPLTAERDEPFGDARGWNEDSGRLEIFRSALTTLQREPLRLLRGCLSRDVMRVANTVLPQEKHHFHNSYLQLLMLTGLPGLLLALGFCLCLLKRILRLLLSGEVPLGVQLLSLPLLGTLLYNLLEVDLFVDTDLRTLSFFLLAGILLGEVRAGRGETA